MDRAAFCKASVTNETYFSGSPKTVGELSPPLSLTMGDGRGDTLGDVLGNKGDNLGLGRRLECDDERSSGSTGEGGLVLLEYDRWYMSRVGVDDTSLIEETRRGSVRSMIGESNGQRMVRLLVLDG